MRRLLLAVVLFVGSIPALAQPTDPNALYVRVVDVGAGLCCVVKMPGGHYMVYDAAVNPAPGPILPACALSIS